MDLSYTVGMSRYILMSIQTRYAEKIFRGEKRWEFRKSLPRHSKDDELTVVVYSSGGDRAVIGEFRVGRVMRCPLDELMRLTGYDTDEQAAQWFSRYYAGRKQCGALEILARLRQSMPAFRPPQNFWYIWPDSDLAVQLSEVSTICPNALSKLSKPRH